MKFEYIGPFFRHSPQKARQKVYSMVNDWNIDNPRSTIFQLDGIEEGEDKENPKPYFASARGHFIPREPILDSTEVQLSESVAESPEKSSRSK
ncbi:MAG: hypothetical protein WDN72_08180 [Alphaproteobacteria bacterium]